MPANAIDLPLLEGAQKLRLKRQGGFACLVEEQGSPMRGLEFSHAPSDGSGEGTLFETKELRFQEGLGDCCTVHDDERARPFTPDVDRPGQ